MLPVIFLALIAGCLYAAITHSIVGTMAVIAIALAVGLLGLYLVKRMSWSGSARRTTWQAGPGARQLPIVSLPQTLRILVVDSEEAFVQRMRSAAFAHGHESIGAADTATALKICRQWV